MKIKTFLPLFTSFNDDIFSFNDEDQTIQNLIDSGEIDEDINTDLFSWNYKEYENRIGKKAVQEVQSMLADIGINLSIKFIKISYSKDYYTQNDKIIVEMEFKPSVLNLIIEKLEEYREQFTEYLINNHTSREGYISFVSNNFNTWINTYLKQDHGQFESCLSECLNFLLLEEQYTTEELADKCKDSENYCNYTIEENRD